MPKVTKKRTIELRHDPLAKQIIEEESVQYLRPTPRQKLRRKGGVEEEDDDGVLPSKLSKRVLDLAEKQRTEEVGGGGGGEGAAKKKTSAKPDKDGEEESGEESDFEVEEEEEVEDVEVDADGYVLGGAVSEEDERAMQLFLPHAGPRGRTLAEMILEKISEKEQQATASKEADDAMSDAGGSTGGVTPKIVQVYSSIAKWLKRYKSGKMPKAFKIVPNLSNWEEVLYLTSPVEWSPQAMREAVKIFASNLNPRMAQRFYNLVLLPAVRDDIANNKRLNFQYYESLKKALFKPAAFFKGILLPLAQENCTLREAVIVCSVLSKVSVPLLHASAALIRLCEMTPWYGTTSIFIAVLLNKKYSLPYKVVDSLVNHFTSFVHDTRSLPVVWHRSLLLFAQRYKYDLSGEQRERLKELLRVHLHDQVGPEIRRELFNAPPGGARPPKPAGGSTGTSRKVSSADAMEI